jgi:hypothetical protein
MGSDFIDRGKRTFAKSWDRARLRLRTSDLFTETPGCAGHSAAFDLLGDLALKPGDTVVVQREGCELVARNGLTTIGRAPNPPNDVLRAGWSPGLNVLICKDFYCKRTPITARSRLCPK